MGYGYGYDSRTGRQVLACDGCGTLGGVKKRKCIYLVTYRDGSSLHYCQAPALCSACFKNEGGSKGVHARCEAGAMASQATYDLERRRLDAGDARVAARFGSWHDLVPTGFVGAIYRDSQGQETRVLVEKDSADSGADWLSDVANPQPWPEVAPSFEAVSA